MTFVKLVHDWLIRVVWVGINQSRARIVQDIMNSDKCYIIYLLRIIDIQIIFYAILLTKNFDNVFFRNGNNLNIPNGLIQLSD